MLNKKVWMLSVVVFFFVQNCFAVIEPATPWQQTENVVSGKAMITNSVTFHNHLYISGMDPFDRGLCPFVYSYNKPNDWKLVSMGIKHPTDYCMSSYLSFAVYQDQLYAGGDGVFYVYNGDDANPNWTSLGLNGMLLTAGNYIAQLSIVNNKLYALVLMGTQVSVYVYNLSNQTWKLVNPGMQQPASFISAPESMISYHNKLYLAVNYAASSAPFTNKPVMYVYNSNDAAPNWTPVFTDPTDRVFGPLSVSNDILFVGGAISPAAYPGLHNQGFVLAYNGNDQVPVWTDVSNGLPVTPIGSNYSYTAITMLGNFTSSSLYASGDRNTDGTFFIYRFNGDVNHPNWIEDDEGLPKVPYAQYQITSFAKLGGLFFMTDLEQNGNNYNPEVYVKGMDSE